MAATTTSNKQGVPAAGVAGLGQLLIRHADWVMGIGVLGMLLTLVTPIAPGLLDALLAANIALSLMMLLVTLNVRDTSELSTFPTLLLFATLFRLGLNVASTRLILSEGKAGSMIEAFGAYVVRDDLTVGLIVFLILIIIQFVVITKGAGRISEVAARFVLDAMPGKQMAIDADLNAGLIDADEARVRRQRVSREAEFYGAMDGASKFVRGDAIAGLIITALNLLGGIIVGTTAGLAFGDAAERYSMLTIGDGLVSQIPALFVSTAAAVLTTRASGKLSLGQNLLAQVGGRPKATIIVAGMLFGIGLLPGMPGTPFFLLATLLMVVWRSTRHTNGSEALLDASGVVVAEPTLAAKAAAEAEAAPKSEDDEVKDLLGVDRISVEIGYRLIPLVKDRNGSGILDHVSQLRRRLASREGVVLPPVRIKDNIRIEPDGYRVLIGGSEVARGTIEPDQFMAMDGGNASGRLHGKAAKDPAFGLPAWWIPESLRDEAEILGYTVVDSVSVLVTHLSEVLRSNYGDILSRDDVKALVEGVKLVSPAVVEELVPDRLGYGEIQQVLRNLLREGVPVRNMPAILEALADSAPRTKDPEQLTEAVRQRLGRTLCELHSDREGTLRAVTLDPAIEARLAGAVGNQKDPDAQPMSPAYLQRLMEKLEQALSDAARGGSEVVVLVRSGARRFLGELVRSSLPRVPVLSYNEVVGAQRVQTAAIVQLDD